MQRLSIVLRPLVLVGALVHAADALPECRSPLNRNYLTPCSTTLATNGPVAIKELGTRENVTLAITADVDPDFPLYSALEFGAVLIFKLFTDSPGGQASSPGVVLNRTVPLTIRKDRKAAGGGWTLWMAVSSAQFPDGRDLPTPGKYEEIHYETLPGSSQQGRRALFAVVNFTTPSLPLEADWVNACALATAEGALPSAYVLDDSAPFPDPTLALYEQLNHQGPWVSECWVGVRPR